MNIHREQQCTAAPVGVMECLNMKFTKIFCLAASLSSHLLYTMCLLGFNLCCTVLSLKRSVSCCLYSESWYWQRSQEGIVVHMLNTNILIYINYFSEYLAKGENKLVCFLTLG